MPLPLFALLALAGTGGAVTGYAGEVQRKKLKAEEDDEFLRRLQLQTAESQKLAKFQSKLDIEKEEAKKAEVNGAAPAPAQPAPTAPPPKPDPRAEEWATKNEWFGQDQTMTYAAFGIHKTLIEQEGFDPNTEEYYTELDNRIRSEFSHKFSDNRKTNAPRVASAGNTASRSGAKKSRTVKLTPSQIAIAKRLGVPLEEYAKHVKE